MLAFGIFGAFGETNDGGVYWVYVSNIFLHQMLAVCVLTLAFGAVGAFGETNGGGVLAFGVFGAFGETNAGGVY